MCLLFLACSFIVPVLQTLTLAALWWRKLTIRGQKKLLMANEVLSAWQYLEVYIIAICVAILQLGDLSRVMMKDVCGLMRPTLDTLHTLDLIDDHHNDCFYVETSVQPGCFLLLIAAILLNVMHQFITRAAGAAIEDREMLRRGLPLVPHYTYFQCLMQPFFCCVDSEGAPESDRERRQTGSGRALCGSRRQLLKQPMSSSDKALLTSDKLRPSERARVDPSRPPLFKNGSSLESIQSTPAEHGEAAGEEGAPDGARPRSPSNRALNAIKRLSGSDPSGGGQYSPLPKRNGSPPEDSRPTANRSATREGSDGRIRLQQQSVLSDQI